MENERKNGNKLKNSLAQMRQRLDDLQASMARQRPAKEIERLVAELRETNERLVMASLENLDRADAAAAEAETARRRLETVLELAPVAVLIGEVPSGKVVLQNEGVERIWRRALVPPERVVDYGEYDGFHPDGRPYRPEEWPLARSIRKGETIVGEEIALARGDGSRGIVLASSAPMRGKRGRIVAGVMVLHDVTDDRLVASHLACLEAAMAALSEASTVDDVVGILLHHGMEAVGASAGSVALLTEDGRAVRLVRDVGYPGQVLAPFRYCPIDAPIPIVEVVRTGRPVFLGSLEERAARYPNLKDVETENRAFAGVPMVARGRSVGALGLSLLEARGLAERERTLLGNLARQGALALLALGLYGSETSIRPGGMPAH